MKNVADQLESEGGVVRSGMVINRGSWSQLEVDESLRDDDPVFGLDDGVVGGISFFEDFLAVDDGGVGLLGVGIFFADELNFALVGEIAKASGFEDGLAHGVSFIDRNFLNAGPVNLADDVDSAADTVGGVHGEKNGGLVIVILFEEDFNFLGEFVKGFTCGWDPAEVGYVDFTGVEDGKCFGRVAIFCDAIIDHVADEEKSFVIDLVHAAGQGGGFDFW